MILSTVTRRRLSKEIMNNIIDCVESSDTAIANAVAILVQMRDAIVTITDNDITLVKGKQIHHAFTDLHNYAARGLMMIKQGGQDQDQDPNISSWEIKGSQGSCYKRQRYINVIGNEVNTCSCPSFNFCKAVIKTCKHI